MDCIEKAHQLLLRNPIVKKYGQIKEHIRIPHKLMIKKTSCRQRRCTSEQFLLKLLHAYQTSPKRVRFYHRRIQSQYIRRHIIFETLLQTYQ